MLIPSHAFLEVWKAKTNMFDDKFLIQINEPAQHLWRANIKHHGHFWINSSAYCVLALGKQHKIHKV